MEQGDELVVEPFHRLIGEKELVTYRYDGFWECMDTFKDKQQLDDMHARGDTPWAVWK
jgi:glucose-1-phosphate cytidylyltransferase